MVKPNTRADPFDLAIRLRDGDEIEALAMLERVYRERRRRAPERTPRPAPTDSAYDEARRRYYAHEQLLREQALLADAVVRELVPSPPGLAEGNAPAPPANAPLRFVDATNAGGRFEVASELGGPVTCELRAGALRGDGEAARVLVEPARFPLAPGARTRVSVEVELARPPERSAALELPLDVLADGAFLRTVWCPVLPADDTPGCNSSETIALRDPDDEILAALRRIQVLVIQHPIAAQAAFAALVAEGRRVARTPEGRAWAQRLERSALLDHLRPVWKMVTLASLEEDAADVLPSAYLDGLFLAAARDKDRILETLSGGERGRPQRR
jgi:hypothetical protein